MVTAYLSALETKTHEGGEAHLVDEMTALVRFLILGSEGGTFYVGEREFTRQNIASLNQVIKEHGKKAVDLIVEISESGRAPKNEPALFALAIAASAQDKEVRAYALSKLNKVARTGTHLFHFIAYAEELRGWGRGFREAVANWYLNRSPLSLAKQVTKYQQRDGWSHKDVIRLAHPNPRNVEQNEIFKYVIGAELIHHYGESGDYLLAVQLAQDAYKSDLLDLIRRYKLPREVLPTQALNDPDVWEALLEDMPMTAMMRNLGVMSKVGLLTQGSDSVRFVNARLHDNEMLAKARIHPIDALKAKMTYQAGHGVRSQAAWTPLRSIVDSLEEAFYTSFSNIEPTGKRLLLALDVSASMAWMGQAAGLAGVPGLSPRVASACLAMVTARTENEYEIMGFSHELVPIDISRFDSLNTVIEKISHIPFGGTDCALPVRHAYESKKMFDAFIVYTDSETSGPDVTNNLVAYRHQSGIHDSKLIVNAMVANEFTIGDPHDKNILNVGGFDSAVPQIMSEFIRGNI